MHQRIAKYYFLLIWTSSFLYVTPVSGYSVKSSEVDSIPGVRILEDIVIYKDTMFHAAFPSVVTLPDGELLLAFRRAPDRAIFGETATSHVDPNSYLVTLQSSDGETWPKEPELLYAHPFGGSQDPCLLQLRDGHLLCTSYGWAFIRPDGLPSLKEPYMVISGEAIFLGGYTLQSGDGGKSWQGPLYPPSVPPEIRWNALRQPLPAYNRGALYEGQEGRIFWAVAVADEADTPQETSVHLLTSQDQGQTWDYSCPIASDDTVVFNETSMYETPKGDLVAFLRTVNFDDQACIARSTDGGKSFQPWQGMGFQGHPLHALRLPDNRVLLTYGYRHAPLGIRARVLNPECTDFATAPEMVLRDDGGTTDIGYPWSVQLDEDRVLVIYYFNVDDGPRHIAGTILEME